MGSDFFICNTHSNFLEIRGEDCAEFLQGLITNDIHKCQKDNPIYSCLLSPQGKFLADFFIAKQPYGYLLEIHEKYFSSFLSKLEIYRLRSKVDFNKNNNISSIIVFSDKDKNIKNSIISFKDPRNNNIGEKVFISNNNNDKIKVEKLNENSFEKYKEILLKNLVPFCPDDLEENKSLLLENNLQNLKSIDWDKGCYVGQEITARMNYRALLKKQIYFLELISGNIKAGDEIEFDNIKIGNVISKVNKYLICMLKIEIVNMIKEKKEVLKINNNVNLNFL